MVAAINSYAEFKEIIASDTPVFIDFWATWCGPCKVISPVFGNIATEVGDKAKFYKVDIDEQAQIAEEVGIRVMPTFIAFKNGDKLGDMSGALPAKLQEFVTAQISAAA